MPIQEQGKGTCCIFEGENVFNAQIWIFFLKTHVEFLPTFLKKKKRKKEKGNWSLDSYQAHDDDRIFKLEENGSIVKTRCENRRQARAHSHQHDQQSL